MEELGNRIRAITCISERKSTTSADLESMTNTIEEMQNFLRSHEQFLQELCKMVRGFMQTKDNYILSDRFMAEFIEKYEHLNFAGYNAGGYAYRESK